MIRRKSLYSLAMEGASGSYYSRSRYGNLSLEEEMVAETEQAVEAASEGEQISQDVAEVERMEDTAQSLEDLAVVADSVEEATPAEAQLVEIAGDMAVAGTDAAAEDVVPSQESYIGRRLSTESIKERARDIWNAIKAFLKRIWTRIKSYWNKVFGANASLLRRVKAMKEKAKNYGSKYTEERTVTITMGVPYLSLGHQPLKKVGDYKKALTHWLDIVGDVYGDLAESVATLGEKIKDAIQEFDENDPNPSGKAVTTIDKAVTNSTAFKFLNKAGKNNGAAHIVHETDALLGCCKVVGTMPIVPAGRSSVMPDPTLLTSLRDARVTIDTVLEKGKEAPKDVEFEIVNPSIVEDCCNMAIKTLEDVIVFERSKACREMFKYEGEINNAGEKLKGRMDRVNEKGDAKEREAIVHFRAVSGLATFYAQRVAQPFGQVAEHNRKVLSSMLILFDRSLGQYKSAT